MDNNITLRSNGASAPGTGVQSQVTTVARRDVRNNREGIWFVIINVDGYRVVEQSVAVNCDLLLESNRQFEGCNQTANITTVIIRRQKFSTLKEGLFTCDSVDLTVTNVEVTVGVQTRVEDDTAVFTLRLSIEVLDVFQDDFLTEWETSRVVTRTEAKVFKCVVTRSGDRRTTQFNVQSLLCRIDRITTDWDQSVFRTRSGVTILCFDSINGVLISFQSRVLDEVKNNFLSFTVLVVISGNKTMDEVVSSTNSRWSIKDRGVSGIVRTDLEPQWIVLVVQRIQLTNRLRELKSTEVGANSRTSWEW